MSIASRYLVTVCRREVLPAVILLLMPILVWILGARPATASSSLPMQSLQGVVESGGVGLAGYEVSLYASSVSGLPPWQKLGAATTNSNGIFEISYASLNGLPHRYQPVLFVLAEDRPVMLASAIGSGPAVASPVTVNERTTVATSVAFAQFVNGRKIQGNEYGVINAAQMVANMADPTTGDIGEVLDNSPNADLTSTRATFNSLANIVASCVSDANDCYTLFTNATEIGRPAPTTVLQALANMTKYPANNVGELFDLSFKNPVYQPALETDRQPTSWLLFIKFTGGFYSDYDAENLMSGPGNVAFDERGFAWINDNYVPTAFTDPPDPTDPAQIGCAGLRLMKFYPWGESFPGSPYFGGGLSGAGFGITIDRKDRIWVGNYGFEAPACFDDPYLIAPDPLKKISATHDSVSVFRPNGEPIFGFAGFTNGHIWWPQGTVSDKKGNVWIANCGNDTVTLIPGETPWKAGNIAIPGGQGAMGNYQPLPVILPTDDGRPLIKPFGIAIDPTGRAWVTGNAFGFDENTEKSDYVGGVFRISKEGIVETLASPSDELVSWPMGISGDSKGNMWVSSSDSVNVPCGTPLDTGEGRELGSAVVYFPANGGPPQSFSGGGLTVPWGNAVDGNDTLWAFNFGQHPIDAIDENTSWPNTPLSHFCGADVSKCPSGLSTGDPISPETGYVSDALDRITGGGIDPSGNLWLMNNWKRTGPFDKVYNTNPGGNSFVIIPGAAGPIKTPLIGPPKGFRK